MVVKGYAVRTSLQYNQPAEDVGFRLVLVGYYMSRRQISQDIVDALGGFWEKAYNVGENVAGNVADVAGGFFEKLGDSIGDVIDSII